MTKFFFVDKINFCHDKSQFCQKRYANINLKVKFVLQK